MKVMTISLLILCNFTLLIAYQNFTDELEDVFAEFEDPNIIPVNQDDDDVHGNSRTSTNPNQNLPPLIQGSDHQRSPQQLQKYRDTILPCFNKLTIANIRTLVDVINVGYDGPSLYLQKSGVKKETIINSVMAHFPLTVLGHFMQKEAWKNTAPTTSPTKTSKKKPFNIITVCLKKWFMGRVHSVSMKIGAKNEENVFKNLPAVLHSNGSNINIISGKEYGLIRSKEVPSMVASIDGMLMACIGDEAAPTAVPIEIKTATTYKTQEVAKKRIRSQK